MDANFGLCQRRAAENTCSVHPPLSGADIFYDQLEVDEYVEQYQVGRGTQVSIML